MFDISIQRFIAVLSVKIETSAFEYFTQISDFPNELYVYRLRALDKVLTAIAYIVNFNQSLYCDHSLELSF